jgi:D-alanyl-D-alanine carboxypeptidase
MRLQVGGGTNGLEPVLRLISLFKRLITSGLVAAGLFAAAVIPAAANPVLVFDAKTGQAIVARDAGKPWYPASLTKILTAYVTFRAIEQGKLSLNTKLTVTKTSSAPPPSKIGFKPGTKVSVDFALQALLVYSANDMASLLAEGVAGSQENFAKLMNATARELGMTGSHFVNPHGLFDKQQVTTARDMGLLTMALMTRYPQAHKYYSAPFVTAGKRKLRNRNHLMKIWDKADGMKTGFVCPSGFNLIGTATVGGRKLVTVIFGTRSGMARAHKAKVVLENAAGYAGSLAVSAITNEAGTPPNLRSTVCGGQGLRMVDANEFNGWGATFGKYKSAAEAEAVVTGIEAVRSAVLKNAPAGVVRLPYTKDFVPVSYAMTQTDSQTLCQVITASGGSCEVVTPATFASFASLSSREKAKGSNPAAATPEAAKTKPARKERTSASGR